MRGKILIVEDDIAISSLIKLQLSTANYETEQIYDGFKSVEMIMKNHYDLILLDVMLPGLSGFEVIQEIKDLDLPIIFLTAKDSVIDKVSGLKLGAEDYIVKPFESIELLARIETVLRRYNKIENIIIFKNIKINIIERTVKKNNKVIDLTLKEFELLYLLVKNKNIALTREIILEKIWNYDYIGGTRTVDIHIGLLRKKLNLHDDIKTVYKIGYRLEI